MCRTALSEKRKSIPAHNNENQDITKYYFNLNEQKRKKNKTIKQWTCRVLVIIITLLNSISIQGCVVIFKELNLAIVEGGPKAIKKYKQLMLHRIKWTEGKNRKQADDEEERRPNTCVLVWEVSQYIYCWYHFILNYFRLGDLL